MQVCSLLITQHTIATYSYNMRIMHSIEEKEEDCFQNVKPKAVLTLKAY